MKGLHRNILVLGKIVVIFFDICCIEFHDVILCLTAFLFNMSIYPESLSPAARICTFVTPILKFRLLSLVDCAWVISAIGELTSDEF